MPQDLVKYSPDVERPEPDFDEHLETVIEATKAYIERSVESEGVGRATRDAHAKGFGLARAEVDILDDLSAEYAQGIYSEPGRHEALIRFSNGSAHSGSDAAIGDVVMGMGLKIFGIEGGKLLDDEPHCTTFDYAMINAPIFFCNTVRHYVFIQKLFLSAGDYFARGRPGLHDFLYDWVTGEGTLEKEDWAWDELAAILSYVRVQPVNLLLSTYWTMGAQRHGDYVAKIRVAPTPTAAETVVRRHLDPKTDIEVFRPALVAELRERPYEFDIQVQLCADLKRMPVEDLTVQWPEGLSPFVTVAKVRLPQQDISGDDIQEAMDATSITPWRSTEEHRPLGNLQRARREVYRQSSILRHALNHQARKEPRTLAEVFGGAPD
jgi:hypothetical protein